MQGKSLEEVDLIFSCNFNYYDVNVHHPQTAAAALRQVNRKRHSRVEDQLVFTGQVANLFGEAISDAGSRPHTPAISRGGGQDGGRTPEFV